MPRVVVVSPPFASHAVPLADLSAALAAENADVHFACSPSFANLTNGTGVGFVPLIVTRNANDGVAEATEQCTGEKARLTEFLDATREGAVHTLLTQARHRRADMLADPHGVLTALRDLNARLRPDWYVVDQLSYPVTLALHCLGLPYATYCPGHPAYVLSGSDALFGVPCYWPRNMHPGGPALDSLRVVARENDRLFNDLFTTFVRGQAPSAPAPGRAFALTSPHAVVYGYPALPWLPERPVGPVHMFAGHMGNPSGDLDEDWKRRLARLRSHVRRVVLVALGTFLSAREDVLRVIATGLLEGTQDTGVLVAAGERVDALADLSSERAMVVAAAEQRELLAHVDAMVHHGGANSFTECLTAGVPALVLPMSSDQFAVAQDAERAGVGRVLDPNRLIPRELPATLDALQETSAASTERWSRKVRARGPRWAAAELSAVMAHSVRRGSNGMHIKP
ncbi:glycosyltransferase [Streptomyces sp. NPDC005047]